MELLFFFFFLCVKVTKTFVLLSWHVTVQRSDVRPTLRDVMMMYSKERLIHGESAECYSKRTAVYTYILTCLCKLQVI